LDVWAGRCPCLTNPSQRGVSNTRFALAHVLWRPPSLTKRFRGEDFFLQPRPTTSPLTLAVRRVHHKETKDVLHGCRCKGWRGRALHLQIATMAEPLSAEQLIEIGLENNYQSWMNPSYPSLMSSNGNLYEMKTSNFYEIFEMKFWPLEMIVFNDCFYSPWFW